jgi:hypothetical protein
MKIFYLFLCGLTLSIFLYSCNSGQARTPVKSDLESIPGKKVSITYTWSPIRAFGSNQLAVWIEDTRGNHIRTLFATRYTATGGYKKRPVALSEWTSKFNLKNASGAEVDAVSGATPEPGVQTLVWNGTDQSGKVVPAGIYVVRMEANIKNADKMFFRGEIKTGDSEQKTTGEITYSSPALASGEILFKNVLVEYK